MTDAWPEQDARPETDASAADANSDALDAEEGNDGSVASDGGYEDATETCDVDTPTQPLFDFADAGGEGNPLIISGIDRLSSLRLMAADGSALMRIPADAGSSLQIDEAPAIVWARCPVTSPQGANTHRLELAVVAPALGDHLNFEHLCGGIARGEPPYEVTFPAADAGAEWSNVTVVADGCLRGEGPGDKILLSRLGNCTATTGNELMAAAYDRAGAPGGYSVSSLPNVSADAGATPVQLPPWIEPSPVTLDARGRSAEARLWIRRRSLKLPAHLRWLTTRPFTFAVPPDLADAYEGELRSIETTPAATFTLFTRAAYLPGSHEVEQLGTLPRVTGSKRYVERCADIPRESMPLRGLEWSTDPGAADAVVIAFTDTYVESACCRRWTTFLLVAPPGLHRLTAAQLGGVSSASLSHISYFDSDRQQGYREFLREPLRVSAARVDNIEHITLERELPVGSTVKEGVLEGLPAP